MPPAPVLLIALLAALVPGAAAQDRGGAPGAEVTRSSPPPPPADAAFLPEPTGPHGVGTRTFHWVLDEGEALTASPSDRREVVAQLLYPARPADGASPAPYVPELDLFRRGLRTHGFPPFAELADRMEAYGRVWAAAVPGAPVPGEAGPFPVVVVSPGGNMSRHWHTALGQELASRGYAVALVSHAYSGMDVFPGAGFTASHLRWHPGDDVPEAEVEARDRELAERLAEDVAAVLEGLGELNREKGPGGIGGALDLERLAVVGHSRGGSTVTRFCRSDDRVDACVVLDNVGEVAGMDAAPARPRLVLRAPWPEDRARRLAGILAGSGADAFEVVLPDADHFSFTDLPLVDPDGYPSEGMPPEEAHRLVAGLTAAFLDRYVRGDDEPFLDAARDLGGTIELRRF